MKARLSALAGLLLSAVCAHAATDLVTEASRLVERGNFRGAVERLRTSAPFPREQIQARFLYATALAGAGDAENAARQFEQLIADFPKQPEPYNNLAALHASQGHLDKAKEVLERAMRTDPSYAAVYDNLSSVYVEMARASYAKALRVNGEARAPNLQLLYVMQGVPADQPAATVVAAAEPVPTPAPASAPEPKAPAPAPAPVKPEPAAANPVPPPAAAVPAPRPPAVPTPTPAAGSSQVAIATTLQEWARVWSARDVEAYLGFYAADFNPVGSQTRAQWVAERRERLGKAQSISVTLENPQVQMVNAQRAIATVIQNYSSSNYSDRTRKQITLVKVGERWLIRNEKSLGMVP